MIHVRKAKDRGGFDHGWLKANHTFSFADYYDEQYMGFRSLRVMNEDFVQPTQGFGTHGHHDMEIVTYILEGELQHKDSMGNGSIIVPGEVQYMSAGTGVRHSEFNPSEKNWVHLYQIWILPDKKGHTPRYGQKKFSDDLKNKKWCLVVSPDGAEGSIAIHQDAKLLATKLESGDSLNYSVKKGRFAWVQVARGGVTLNGHPLLASDGAAVAEEELLSFSSAQAGTEILLFDLL